jgi:TrpR-related protein YerC/YecD
METTELNELFSDITYLNNSKEFSMFFHDLCTISELTEMSKRWKAAKLLSSGEPIRKISKDTGLSTTTVSRVNQWKNQIGKGGYDILLNKIK